jgi:hypothetical protein
MLRCKVNRKIRNYQEIHSKTYANNQKHMIRASAKRKALVNRGLSSGSYIQKESEMNI